MNTIDSQPAHRVLFTAAASFNWLAGLPLLVAPGFAASWLGFDLNDTALLFLRMIVGLILVFGVVYLMISRDPVRYRVYIPLGIVLKIWLVLVVYATWIAGGIPWPFPALVAGDIVFAALFWRYYRRTG